MKVFDLGNNGFVSEAVRVALGEPPHIRQARVLMVAPSKAAAVRLAEAARGVDVPAVRDLRPASGVDVEVLRAAGELDTPAILVTPLQRGGEVPVVRVGERDVARVGRLWWHGFERRFTRGEG